jgi:hypothetical protein
MSIIASTVMDRARTSYLNDAGATLYTNTVLLPILTDVSEELGDEMTKHGLQVNKSVESVEFSVTAGGTTLSPLPDDLIVPVDLWAIQEGFTAESDWQLMRKTTWPVHQDADSGIGPWQFRENAIKFTPSTLNYTIRLNYIRFITAVTGNNSVIEVKDSIGALAARTAEIAARFIGSNTQLADQIAVKASKRLNDLLTINVNNEQKNQRGRRRPFRSATTWRTR